MAVAFPRTNKRRTVLRQKMFGTTFAGYAQRGLYRSRKTLSRSPARAVLWPASFLQLILPRLQFSRF
jgi:hypothetical protein